MKTQTEVEETIEPLLTDVISGFISHPDQLRIDTARMGGLYQFNVDGNPDDLPKIVGKYSKNLAALHTLFGAMLRVIGLSIRIKVAYRPEARTNAANAAWFVDKPDWPREDFTELLRDVLSQLCANTPAIREQILPAKLMRFNDKPVRGGEEQSVFFVAPSYADLPVFTTEIETAIELIFRAIGQQQGRRITISFTNAQQGSA